MRRIMSRWPTPSAFSARAARGGEQAQDYFRATCSPRCLRRQRRRAIRSTRMLVRQRIGRLAPPPALRVLAGAAGFLFCRSIVSKSRDSSTRRADRRQAGGRPAGRETASLPLARPWNRLRQWPGLWKGRRWFSSLSRFGGQPKPARDHRAPGRASDPARDVAKAGLSGGLAPRS